MCKYYTGVGSRSVDDMPEMKAFMNRFAKKASERGWTLRSGGAKGSDLAFENGSNASHIFYTEDWKEKHGPRFKNQPTGIVKHNYIIEHIEEARTIAQRIHPAWERCNHYAQLLHTRNCFQVLGPTLDTPSSFLICWTQDGQLKGGTRTAIVLAQENNIPVINLGKKSDYELAERLLQRP